MVVAALIPHITLITERDRARRVAVALEQQVAAAAALHVPSSHGTGEPHAVDLCPTCVVPAPCPTSVALGTDPLEDS